MANDITLTQPDLIQRLLDNLPAGYTVAKVKLPNAPFTTPKSTKWLRATVNLNSSDNVTPDGYQRTYGIYTIDIFYPKGKGDKAQNEDAKLIRAIFNNQEFNNTKCLASSILSGDEDGAWYKVSVDTEFYFEGV